MTLRKLVQQWEDNAQVQLTDESYSVKLTLKDAAKIAALHEMYPLRTEEQIITELVSAALRELEESLPYVQGKKIISTDEFGDPIYEDVGPTPIFGELTRKHLAELEKGDK